MTNPNLQNNVAVEAFQVPKLTEWLRRANFGDVISSTTHSVDFDGSRAEYIYMRVRLLALIFAVLSVLWIPLDVLIVPEGMFTSILVLRLCYSLLFFLLAMSTGRAQKLKYAQLRIAVFVIIPCLFYIGSRVVLSGNESTQSALMGYSFLPYLSVVLLAVFPLTLKEGVSYASVVGITFLGSEIYFSEALSISALIDLWLLTLLAGIAIWAQLAQLHMLLRLYREASRDALTGLVNRRVLNKWLNLEISRARENRHSLSVILFDLDFFKRVNDTYGHLTGDRVLQTFSRLLKRDLAGFNLIGRYGGEEFIAVLPRQDASAAMSIAEKIRTNCHDVSTRGPKGSTVGFTVSVGVTELTDLDTAETLIHRVDKGLYSAKMNGRDTVVMAQVHETGSVE